MNKNSTNYSQILFLSALFLSPLIFFTGVTRNPYLIQERILQIFLASALLLLFFTNAGHINFPLTFIDRPLWVFFFVAFASFLLSFLRYPEFSSSFIHYGGRRMLLLVFSGLIPFYFTAGSSSDFREKIKKTVIAAGSIAAAYAVLQFFNSVINGVNFDFIWGEALDPYGARSISTFGNPNFLSAYLMVVIFWIMGYIFTKKSPLWVFLMILNTGALAITMTRSTFAGVIVGLTVLLFVLSSEYGKKYKKFKKTMLHTLVIIAVMGGLFFKISRQFRQRIKGMVSVQQMGSALVQRLLIWESSANMFVEDPVVGRGWGNFEIFYPFYQGKVVEKKQYRMLRTHANNAHNFILELLTQVGIIGTGIYIWLMVVFVFFAIKIFKKAKDKDKIWVAVFSAAAISFWTDNLLNVSLYFPIPAFAFWINAGLLAGKDRELSGCPLRKIALNKMKKATAVFVLIFTAGVIYFNCIYFKSSVHFFRGFKYARSNHPRDAEKKLLKAWRTYPLIVDNNYELGNVYVKLSRQDNGENLRKAEWAYREALKANPGYDEIYYNLGVVYLMREDYEQAESYLKKTLKINPIAEKAYLTLGDIYGKRQEFNEAAEYYRSAAEVGASSVRLYNNLGYYLQKQGKISQALESYVRTLQIEPENGQARSSILRIKTTYSNEVNTPEMNSCFLRAERYIQNRNWEKALEEVKKVLDVNPASVKALLYAGNIYFNLDKTNKAVEKYQLILAIDPGNETARRNLEAVTK